MGEEAYDEFELAAEHPHDADDRRTLVVRGGYSRDEVYIGICRSKDDKPDEIIAVNGHELKRALRSMVIGEPRRKRGQRTRVRAADRMGSDAMTITDEQLAECEELARNANSPYVGTPSAYEAIHTLIAELRRLRGSQQSQNAMATSAEQDALGEKQYLADEIRRLRAELAADRAAVGDR